MRYIVKGFNNTSLEMYERETFTLEEAKATAEYFHICYSCDFVVAVDNSTGKQVYTIG